MIWKKTKYALEGLVVIPRTLQAYLLLVALLCIFGIFWIVASLMPFEPVKFYGWTRLPETACPGDDINGAFEAEVVGGPYTIGHMRGISYWVDENGDPLPGVVPIDHDLKVAPRHEYKEVSERIAPTVHGRARPAWDATINGWMFGIVPVNTEHQYVAEQSVKILPDKQCEGQGVSE